MSTVIGTVVILLTVLATGALVVYAVAVDASVEINHVVWSRP